MLANLTIFHFIRFSFRDEFLRLENSHPAKKLSRLIEKELGHKIKVYVTYAIVGILIASPFPDELAVMLLAGLTKIKPIVLAKVTLVLSFIGISILLRI